MKTFSLSLFFLCLMVLSCNTYSQQGQIDSIKMYPTFPTSNDSTTFLIYLLFNSGTCHTKVQNIIVNTPDIINTSSYCYGDYMYMCNNVDSIKLPRLPKGNYTFHYKLKSSALFSGCTNYLPADSVNFPFSIEYPAGIDNFQTIPDLFTIFTDVYTRDLEIKLSESNRTARMYIYDLSGRKIFETNLFAPKSKLFLNLSDGLYLINVCVEGKSQTKKLVINYNH